MFLFAFNFLIVIAALATNSCLTNPTSKGVQNLQNGNEKAIVSDEWKPGVFKGLIVGKSSRSDVLKTLGDPISTGNAGDDLPKTSTDTGIVDEYSYVDGFRGKLVVTSSKKTKLVTSIVIYPDDLALKDVTPLYGDRYTKTRYSFVQCTGDAGSSAIKESKKGDLEFIEFRSSGIVIDANNPEQKVKSIEYVGGPIGINEPSCKQ